MRTARWTALTAAVVATLAVAACALVDDEPTGDATSTADGLATVQDGVLTIATRPDPAYEPWVVDNDQQR